jgi:RimJ/RimL family protein N-acetyltransferase
MSPPIILQGEHVRLEPLALDHLDAVLEASNADPSLYRWSPVPLTAQAARTYIETAIAWRDAGSALPFATVRLKDGKVVGSTRFFLIERWPWPPGHERFAREHPDACEIGYTWLTASAIRTPINTEAKLLMLTHAFETWGVLRVCLHTDSRNERSRNAMLRIGAKFEGILRSHRIAADSIARDSARFSIIASEWPEVKSRLKNLLAER